jgi:hypothetical protein
MGLDGRHGNAIHPGEQAHEICRAILARNRRNLQAGTGRDQTRKREPGGARGEPFEQLVLQIENFQRLLAIGDLEHEPRPHIVLQHEIPIALARQRFGGEREPVQFARQARRVIGGKFGRRRHVHGNTISTAAERSLSLGGTVLSNALTA